MLPRHIALWIHAQQYDTPFLSCYLFVRVSALTDHVFVQHKPVSYLDKLASVQQTLGVDRAVADALTSALDSDDCALPQESSLHCWLSELANCWTGTGLPIIRVVPVLQKQPGLRFVRVETIHNTLTWLCGALLAPLYQLQVCLNRYAIELF